MGQRIRRALYLSAIAGLTIAGLRAANDAELNVQHADCTLFGPQREKFPKQARERFALSAQTEQVSRILGGRTRAADAPGDSRTSTYQQSGSSNLIDKYIFAALTAAGVTPADKTNDYEFIRRVTLDLTGRIPTPERVQAFAADNSADKRAKLVDELLAKPEFVDKWTMYFGDRLKNATIKTGVRVYDGGRNAFYLWIKDAVANNRPWDAVTRDLISAQGTNSYEQAQGATNWIVGGRVANGPVQDIWDAQAASVAETFLGVSAVNCLECHNGRGHLDTLSLWGSQVTRYQAWQWAAFLSHSNEVATPVDATVANSDRYWSTVDEVKPYNVDYPLNTTTGNRPARQPVGTLKNVAPLNLFTGEKPKTGESYRAALARMVTGDPQFARASVNYIWAEFFGRGIVNPPNQFDPARLDANNPPPDPWTLQPSNPALLEALAADFVANGYDTKKLMRLIVTSDTYQLSSSYNGNWNPSWEPLFARKLVRRLWGEEIMDGLAQASNIIPTYTVAPLPPFNWAMQAPEPLTITRGNNILTSFMPGNRDDQERKTDGAVQEALSMMNDTLVMARTRATGTGAAASLLARATGGTNDQLVTTLYLTVLSRLPSDAEKTAAIAALSSGTRQQKAEDLLWSLYNKVDFLFNY